MQEKQAAIDDTPQVTRSPSFSGMGVSLPDPRRFMHSEEIFLRLWKACAGCCEW